MDDTTSLTPVLVGLAGMRVLPAADAAGELEMPIETAPGAVGCPGCWGGGAGEGPPPDVGAGPAQWWAPGRAVLVETGMGVPRPGLPVRTWTETHPGIAARATLTERARTWAVHQVGSRDATVAGVARELGVAWWTVMNLVIAHGTPLVDDPARLAPRELDGSVTMPAIAAVTAVGWMRRRSCGPGAGGPPSSSPASSTSPPVARPDFWTSSKAARGTVLGKRRRRHFRAGQ